MATATGFTYKGVDLSNIYVCSINTKELMYGYNLLQSTSNYGKIYNLFKPNILGYSYNNIDISTYLTAKYTEYNTTVNFVNPNSAKMITAIAIGAGGGGGGHGGKASGTGANGGSDSAFGGSGGRGGYGSYSTYKTKILQNSNININIGIGGSGGNSGGDSNANSNYNASNIKYNNPVAIGGNGNSGNSGSPTTINIDGTTIIYANGGNGGNGGNGAYCNTGASNANATRGIDGISGTPSIDQYNIAGPNYYYNLSNSGNPGSGVQDGGGVSTAYSGNNGKVVIIWLYD